MASVRSAKNNLIHHGGNHCQDLGDPEAKNIAL
jgi:hypothetical protein